LHIVDCTLEIYKISTVQTANKIFPQSAENGTKCCVISGFRYALLFNATPIGSYLPTFRGNLSVPSWKVKNYPWLAVPKVQ